MNRKKVLRLAAIIVVFFAVLNIIFYQKMYLKEPVFLQHYLETDLKDMLQITYITNRKDKDSIEDIWIYTQEGIEAFYRPSIEIRQTIGNYQIVTTGLHIGFTKQKLDEVASVLFTCKEMKVDMKQRGIATYPLLGTLAHTNGDALSRTFAAFGTGYANNKLQSYIIHHPKQTLKLTDFRYNLQSPNLKINITCEEQPIEKDTKILLPKDKTAVFDGVIAAKPNTEEFASCYQIRVTAQVTEENQNVCEVPVISLYYTPQFHYGTLVQYLKSRQAIL